MDGGWMDDDGAMVMMKNVLLYSFCFGLLLLLS